MGSEHLRFRLHGLIALAGPVLMIVIGCTSTPRKIEVMDYPTGVLPQSYHQNFDTCYYRKSPNGGLEVVAQRWPEADEQGRKLASQTLQIRVFFDPIPSRSPSDPSMTNALIGYMVIGEGSTCSFDGGGFVSWKEHRFDDDLTIYVERSALKPQRLLGDSTPIFERPSVIGRLTAVRDDRKVVDVLNEMRRTFGPLPDEEPPITDPSLR